VPGQKSEYLTHGQRDALAAELAELEGPKRTEIVAAIKTAREFGDLSENFEYHAAKNEQGLLERRITILRSRLEHAVVVDEPVSSDEVGIGSRVELEDESGGTMEVEISGRRRRRHGVAGLAARLRAPRRAGRAVGRDRSAAGVVDGARARDPLAVAVGDPAARQVVRRQLDLDPVAGEDLDAEPPHLPAGVPERLVPVVEGDLEHPAAEGLDHLALQLDLLFLRGDTRLLRRFSQV